MPDKQNNKDRHKARQRADQALARWLRGEVDKVEFWTTPRGERVVDEYNRHERKES